MCDSVLTVAPIVTLSKSMFHGGRPVPEESTAFAQAVTIRVGDSTQLLTGRGSRDIVAGLEQAVSHGRLQPGQALPSVRALADQLGISPATVANAYRMLGQRGVVEVRSKRTIVRVVPVQAVIDRWWIHRPPSARMLSLSLPNPDFLPRVDEHLLTHAIRGYGHPVKSRADNPIDPELAAILASWFAEDDIPADHLLLASGHLDAIRRALQLFLRHGDPIAVEDPNEDIILQMVSNLGLRPVPVSVDDEGPEPHSLRSALATGAQVLLITSRAQHPTGAAVSEERSEALRTLLFDRRGTLVIELDRGHGVADSSLHSLAGITNQWLHVRNIDAAFGADLRLAPVSGDEHSIRLLRAMQRDDIEWISFLQQRIMIELLSSTKEIVEGAAHAYRHRRELLINALAEHGIHARGRTGYDVWVPLPSTVDEMGVVIRLMNAGWVVAPGKPMRITSPPALRITVAEMTLEDIVPFCDALIDALSPANR